jgi:hypothetical protein
VKKTNQFLPGISTQLQGRAKRRQLEALRILREKLLPRSIADIAVLFGGILPAAVLEQEQSDIRKRTYPEVVTFWAWISQLLECNVSCSSAVTFVQNWHASAGLSIPAFDTSSYCRARMRLSNEFLNRMLSLTKTYMDARIEAHHLWYGFRLKAIDGTSVKLMDTKANQVPFPQPSGQKPGCGFPVMGLTGILDLATGRIDHFLTSEDRQHDSKGLYQLSKHLQKGDLLLADRAYCSYEAIAGLQTRGVESVMRLHQMRHKKLDWRQGKKLDADSRLVTWKRPPKPGTSGITWDEWNELPEEIELRLVRMKGRSRDGKARTMYVVTTLTDASLYPTEEIGLLYGERWKIEVKFRDIKTTMDLEMLRVKTPAMAVKTMKMIQIAYNLVKALQLEAISGRAIMIDDIGYKATLDVIIEFRSRFRALQNHPQIWKKVMSNLEERIAERLLHIRPNRSEPRASKRRPKSYQYLTSPRAEFTEIPHREHYRKAS